MAKADCPICEASGFRSCDECGTPVFPPFAAPLGAVKDLCAYCEEDAGKP